MHAEINSYYLQIIVVNKFEAKVFDCLTGTLVKVHENIAPTGADITQFRQDARNRKCYVADVLGKIRVFNVSSGMLIKEVTEEKKEEAVYLSDRDDNSVFGSDNDQNDSKINEEASSQEVSTANSPKQEKSPVAKFKSKVSEITGMQLIWEDDYILMLCCDA
jgi:hypothetical protein